MIIDDRNQPVELTGKPPKEITVIDDIADIGDQTHNKNRVRYLTESEAKILAEEVFEEAEQAAAATANEYVREWIKRVLQEKVEELFPRSERMQESAKQCILEHL